MTRRSVCGCRVNAVSLRGATQYGIRKAKDNMATRHSPPQVLPDAAAIYKVDTEAIALKFKQEFAAKEKTREGCLAFVLT
jgi:hypothetical protein